MRKPWLLGTLSLLVALLAGCGGQTGPAPLGGMPRPRTTSAWRCCLWLRKASGALAT